MTMLDVYLIGVVVSTALLLIYTMWYIREFNKITLTNIASGIFMIFLSWGGVVLLLTALASVVIDWLYDKGDKIIIYKRKSEEK